MRSILRGAVFSVLGVLFLASALFAQTLTVRVPRGNVRARPATTSPIIGKIKKGEQYNVEARRGDWFNRNFPYQLAWVVSGPLSR